jgi:hypothetical protein
MPYGTFHSENSTRAGIRASTNIRALCRSLAATQFDHVEDVVFIVEIDQQQISALGTTSGETTVGDLSCRLFP